MSMTHRTIQRYFIQSSQGDLYGTNSLKGFTERGAAYKLEILKRLYPRRAFKILQPQSFKELTSGTSEAD